MKTILIATQKPFAPSAIKQMKQVCENAGYQLEVLEKYENQNQWIEAAKNADAMIIRSDKANRDVLSAAKNLKVIVRAGAGYDNIDLQAATDNNIVAMNTPGQNSNAVAELSVGLMVYSARGLFNGKPGTELKNKTLGIHAFGNVGKLVAKIAKGFGMKIFAFDPFIDDEKIENTGATACQSVEELYENSQYISLHIPSNEKTKNSINCSLIKLMPKNACIVNTARKEVIHEKCLQKMLEKRNDFRYVSDIAPDCANELTNKFGNRVYFTPKKMGAQTAEANINAGVAATQQIIDFLEKGIDTFRVN